MMSPIGSEGPSLTVMMPVLSSAPLMTIGAEAVDRVEVLGHLLDRALLGGRAHRQVIDARVGDDDELRQVEGVGAFTQNLALRTALAADAP